MAKRKVTEDPIVHFKAAKKIQRWVDVIRYSPPDGQVRVTLMEDGWEDFWVVDVDGVNHGKQVAQRFLNDGQIPKDAYQ